VLLPWEQYSGRRRQVLRQNIELMRRFTDFIQTEAKTALRRWIGRLVRLRAWTAAWTVAL